MPLFTFTVVGTDDGAPPLSSAVSVTIVINDMNDNPPIITPTPINPLLPEDTPIGTIVTTLSISDADSSDLNGPTMLQIVSGDSAHFNLSSNSILLSAPLDYEAQQQYTLTISAVDTSHTTLSSNYSLVVTVTDVNDNPPLFSQSSYEITVNETTPVDHMLLLLILTDADTGVNAVVELFIVSGDDSNTFDLLDSGELLLNQTLDYETESLYQLQIEAVNIDAAIMLSSTANVTIRVTDVNEFPPEFSLSVYQATITEGPGSDGVLVTTVSASDRDTDDAISYSISATEFNISSTGNVFTTTVFDREMVDHYSVEVLAVDSGSPPKTSSALINVAIEDINDNAPVFSSAVESVNVSESAPLGDEVAIVNVTDADIGPNGQVSLSLVDAISSWSLSSDGILSVAGPLNATDVPSYSLTILAVDGGSPPLSSSAQLVISVQPLFPETPLFTQSVYPASVPENTPTSSVTIVTATSSDSDLATDYSFSPVTTTLFGSLFSINSSSGAVTTSQSLDRETQDHYQLSVVATTTLNDRQSSSNALVNVTVLDVNDHAPVFINPPATVVLLEYSPANQLLVQYVTSDEDINENAIVTYSISGGNGSAVGVVSIDSATGALRSTGVSVPGGTWLTIIITASNPLSDTPLLNTSTQLTIYVQPVNPSVPEFPQDSYNLSVSESTTVGTVLVVAMASDGSGDDASNITYSLEAGVGVVSIRPITGELVLATPLDYEQETVYVFSVIATDSDLPPLTSRVDITLTVLDANDNPPIFTDANYTITITENTPANMTLVTVSTTDADSLINSAVVYSIIDGDTDLFMISPSGLRSAVITSSIPLDREDMGVHYITIQARNAGGGVTLIAAVNVTIVVADINDNTPLFNQSERTVYVTLPVQLNETVTIAQATDRDSNGGLVYSLNTSAPFSINSLTGAISSTQQLLLPTNHSMLVTASDGTLSSSTAIIIVLLYSTTLSLNREQDLVFSTDEGVELVDVPSSADGTSVLQHYSLVVGQSPRQPRALRAQLGDVSSSLSVQPGLSPAASVESFLLTRELWYDSPIIAVAVQARDHRNNIHTTPTIVTCLATHASLGNSTSECTTSENGTCIVAIDIPLDWFLADTTATVSCGLASSLITGVVMLYERQAFNISSDEYIFMELPSSSLFRGDLFSFPVHAEAGSSAVGSYTIRIRSSADFELLNVSVNSSIWLSSSTTVVPGQEILITASQTSSALPVGRVQLLVVEARVRETASEDMLHTSVFNMTIHFLSDIDRATLLPPAGVESQLGHVISRTGVSFTGSVFVDANIPRGVFLQAPSNELVNTAVLSTNNVTTPLTVLLGRQSGGLYIASVGVVCSSDDPSIVSVAPDCSSAILTSSHRAPSSGTLVRASIDGVTGTLSLRVWTPLLNTTQLIVENQELSRIANWMEQDGGSCREQYQRTRAVILVNFTDSMVAIGNIRVTHLMQHGLVSTDTSVMSVQGDTLVGVSPGTAIAQLMSVDSILLAETIVTVTSQPVDILGLDVQVLTSLNLTSSPMQPHPLGINYLRVTTEQLFDFEDVTGFVVVSAVFDDDSRMILDSSSNLLITTVKGSSHLVSLTGNRVSPRSSGEGQLLAVWSSATSCGGQLLSSGLGSFSISLPLPSSIAVSFISALSAPGSAASLVGIPSSTLLSVVAVFPSTTVVLTNDARTRYTLSTNMLTLGSNGVLSVNSEAAPALHHINITFDQYPTVTRTIQVEVVGVSGLTLSASPFPVYLGSSEVNITSLRPIAATGLIQRAVISVTAMLTSGTSLDVSNNPDVSITVSSTPSSLSPTITSERVISVTNSSSGSVEVCAMVGGVTCSTPLTLTVSAVPVTVTTITVHDFLDNTFRGLSGIQHQTIVSVMFSDGTEYLNLTPSQLPNLVTFQATLPVTVNSQSGIATLMGNSFPFASITVSAVGSSVEGTLQFHCNLDPAVGDVDVGMVTGAPIPTQTAGSEFIVAIRVNSGQSILDSAQLVIQFDPSLLQAVSASPGIDWTPASSFAHGDQSVNDVITLGGSLTGGLGPVQGSSLHLADVVFRPIAPGSGFINGSITTLARRVEGSDVAPNIGMVPRPFIAGSVQLMVTSSSRKRSILPRERRQAVCDENSVCDVCSPEREVGDLDGNCRFDVRDISFLQLHYLNTIATGTPAPLPPDRAANLDPDLSGSTDPNDVIFLLRAAFQLYHFVTSTLISPVTEESCDLVFNVTVMQRGNVPPDPQFTALLVDFAHQDPLFQAEFDATNFTIGSVLSTNKGPGQYGGVVRMEYVDDQFVLEADSALNMSSIGVSLVLVTFDVFGKTSSMRVAAMFGEGAPLYPALDKSVTVMGETVTIQAQNGYAPLITANSSLTSERCVTLMLPIMFDQDSYTAAVVENSPTNTLVLQLVAIASHPDAVVSYTLINTSSLPFLVNSSGSLVVAGSLDYESTSSYQLTVEASETRRNTTAITSVSVSVTNINDVPPILMAITNLTIPANTSMGTRILLVSASDPDMLDPITYTITNESPAGSVAIDSTTGEITALSSLLSIGNGAIDLTVSVSDSSFTVSSAVTISTFQPSFTQLMYSAVVPEDTPTGTPVVMVTLLDTETENFTYHIIPPSASIMDSSDMTPSIYQLSIDSSGAVLVNETLDHEKGQVLNYTIIASSEHFIIEANLSIIVSDINDNTPVFSQSGYSLSLISSLPVGSSFLLIQATDSDSAPHSMITFSITPSLGAGFISIVPTNGSLVIAQSLLSAPSTFSLTVVASDGVLNTSVIVNVTVEPAILTPSIPYPPQLSSTSGVLLLGPGPQDNGGNVFTQQVVSLASTASRITANSSTIESSQSVNISLLPPVRVRAVLLHHSNDVYHDQRVIRFAVQVHDTHHLTLTTPISVIVYAQLGTVPAMTGCTLSSSDGVCVAALTVPSDWFTAVEATVPWFYQIPAQLPLLGDGSLVLKGVSEVQVTNQIMVQLPASPVLAGDAVNITVHGFTKYAVTSFSVVLTMDGAVVEKVTGLLWSLSTVTDGSSLGVVGVVSTPLDSLSVPTTELFTVQVRVPLTAMDGQQLAMTGWVHSLSDVVEGPVYMNTSRQGPVLFVSGGLLGTEGTITVVTEKVVALFAYASQTQLLNTAALGGPVMQQPVEYRVGYSTGRTEPYSGPINCSSLHPQVIGVSSDCLSLRLTGGEQNGSNSAMIRFSVGAISTELLISVFYPDIASLQLTLSDATLDAVQYSLHDGCDTVRQQATVQAYANFSTPSSTLSVVLVTDHVRPLLVSQNTSVAVVNDGIVQGVLAGSTQVCVAVPSLGNIACSPVTVSPSLVHVAALSVSVVSSISLSLSPLSPLLPQSVMVQVTSVLNRDDGALLAALVYTDNTSLIIDPASLQLHSLTPGIVSVSSSGALAPVNNGDGRVMVTWTAPGSTCGVEVVQTIDVSVSLVQPELIITSPSSDGVNPLTSPLDPAVVAGISTEYQLHVLLVFAGNKTINVTLDDTTVYNASSSKISIVRTDQSVHVSSGTGTGLAHVTVLLTQYNMSVNITFHVVAMDTLSLSFLPYPSFPGSSPVTSVGRVAGTTTWQQVMAHLTLNTTDGLTHDITNSSSVLYEIDLVSISTVTASISSAHVIMVTPTAGNDSSGVVTVTARLQPTAVAQSFLVVSSIPVQITGVIVAPLPNNTLVGVVGHASYQLGVSLLLSDGTRYSDVFNSDLTQLRGLVSIVSSDSDSVAVASDGYLVPLANTRDLASVVVTAGSHSHEVQFHVNLDPVVGDIDLGHRAGPPVIQDGDILVIPVYCNTGGELIGAVEASLMYDPSVLSVTNVTVGGDWEAGLHYESAGQGEVLFTGVQLGGGVGGVRVHLFSVTFTVAAAAVTHLTGHVANLRPQVANSSTIGLPTPRVSQAANISLAVSGVTKRDLPRVVKRQLPSLPACSTHGDTNSDCVFDSSDVFYSLLYVSHELFNFSSPDGQYLITLLNISQLDPSMDAVISPDDSYLLFRALVDLVPFVTNVKVTPVQDVTSSCLLSVAVATSGPARLFVDISLRNSSLQSDYDASIVAMGTAIDSSRGVGLYGGTLEANSMMRVALNTSLVSDDIGVSLVLQTLDASNQTSIARTVQLLGGPPVLYQLPLLVNTSSSILLSASSGYSSLVTINNTLSSLQCSDLPLISTELNVTFLSPYQALLMWSLDNQRPQLNFTGSINVTVTQCSVSQSVMVIETSCSDYSVSADHDTMTTLTTSPFTAYTLQVVSRLAHSLPVQITSPEAGSFYY